MVKTYAACGYVYGSNNYGMVYGKTTHGMAW